MLQQKIILYGKKQNQLNCLKKSVTKLQKLNLKLC